MWDLRALRSSLLRAKKPPSQAVHKMRGFLRAPDDGDILWSIILARSRVVFVEDDIERPVQMVFYAPMGSIDLQHALGREPFGEGDIVHPAGGLSFAQPPLGFDASERGEAGKGRRIRGRRDYAGAPPLLTVMSALDPLMEGKLALFVGLRESLERTGKQRPVVSLQLQGVMTPLGADLLGHSRVAMQGVGSHGAAS